MYYPDEHKKNQKFTDHRKHRMIVQLRKTHQDKEEEKRKYFLLFKWVLLQQIKDKNLIKNSNHFRKIVYAGNFIKRTKAL